LIKLLHFWILPRNGVLCIDAATDFRIRLRTQKNKTTTGKTTMDDQSDLIEMTAGIVSAYVGNNIVTTADLPALIHQVHRALAAVGSAAEAEAAPPKEPAVPVKRSIAPDHLVCLEDGRKFKSLKRHLRTKYNMSPEEYRAKWNLPKDYPMVAPNYAKARSELAKQMGLGQGGRKPPRKTK
jgi:predicted transcriptional regulator